MITDVKQLHTFVQDMMGRDFSFDVETSGLDSHEERTLGLSLTYRDAKDTLHSEYVVFEHTMPRADDKMFGVPNHFIERKVARFALQPLFAQTDVTMVAHNMSFDLAFLWNLGLDPQGTLHDTMIGEFYLNENRSSYGLKQTANRVFGVTMDQYKDLYTYRNYKKEEFLSVALAPAAHYAEDDTRYTYRLFERQVLMMKQEKVYKPFTRLAMPLCRVIAQMQVKGFAYDIEAANELWAEYEELSKTYEERVWNAGMDMLDEREDIPPIYLKIIDHLVHAGVQVQTTATGDVYVRGRKVKVIQPTPRSKPRVPYFNVGSRTQLADLLYDYQGIHPPTRVRLKTNKDGSLKVDKDTLIVTKYFMGEDCPQVIDDVLEWRKADKLIGTYLAPFSKLADPKDHHAIRANFNQTIARTGRLSSSSPNLQNVSARKELGKRVRSLFVARPHHKLVIFDYSQLELRLLAHYSEDEALLHAFTHGLDLHTVTGARQAGLTYEELSERVANDETEAKLIRTIGKTANFGLSYGMGAYKYQVYLLVNNNMFFEIDEVQRQIDGFNQAYIQLFDFKQSLPEQLMKRGYIRTISGRKRRLPDIYSDDIWERRAAERQAVNVLAQGGGADIMGMAMIEIQNSIAPYNAQILVQVHDEIVVEAPDEHAEEVASVMRECMLKVNGILRCPLEVSGGIGDNWYDAK